MERLKKFLFVGASSLLLFCFPAFAEELEASELPIEEVNHDIELINDSKKEASDITIDNLAEIQGGMVKAPSIYPDVPFRFIGFNTISAENGFKVSILFEGTINDFFVILPNGSSARSPDYITTDTYPFGTTITSIRIGSADGQILWSGAYTVNSNNVGNPYYADSVPISIYLNNVGQVFKWLLATIGTLITFILGNPFLAVSLLLFMAGTVISFYIRIKNS